MTQTRRAGRLGTLLVLMASAACSSRGTRGPTTDDETPPFCPAGGGAGGASGAEGATAEAGSSAGGEPSAPFDPCPQTGDCKILPLGDSITFGNPTANGGYRVELFARAAADCKHITFVGGQRNGPDKVLGLPFPKQNEGHPGWTISQIIDIATTDQALVDAPAIVLLHIGTNDMFRGPEGATERLTTLIDQLILALPNSLLAVSSIIPLPPAAEDAEAFDAPVPGIVEARAQSGAHIIYVDQLDGFPSNGFARDKVHPNDAVGYAWMGDTWYEAIEPYLH
jgi:hypothetical protein